MSPDPDRSAARSNAWPGAIYAITMFVEDLDAARAFYRQVFELPVFFETHNSVVFKFGELAVNLLRISEAPGLVGPATVAASEAGVRHQMTLHVDDLDATCDKLTTRGVALLNGPVDRPWGVRTASFRDPGGHVWEIGQPLNPADS